MKTRRLKRKRIKRNKRKTFRGGLSIPFADLGNIFNNATSSIGSMMSTFTVLPAGYNAPDMPGLEKQFVTPYSGGR